RGDDDFPVVVFDVRWLEHAVLERSFRLRGNPSAAMDIGPSEQPSGSLRTPNYRSTIPQYRASRSRSVPSRCCSGADGYGGEVLTRALTPPPNAEAMTNTRSRRAKRTVPTAISSARTASPPPRSLAPDGPRAASRQASTGPRTTSARGPQAWAAR